MVFSFTKEIFPDKKTFTNPSPSLRSTCGLLCRSKLNGAAKIYFAAYLRFWPQNQSNSYFDLSQKHEKAVPQKKISRLVSTGTIEYFPIIFHFLFFWKSKSWSSLKITDLLEKKVSGLRSISINIAIQDWRVWFSDWEWFFRGDRYYQYI